MLLTLSSCTEMEPAGDWLDVVSLMVWGMVLVVSVAVMGSLMLAPSASDQREEDGEAHGEQRCYEHAEA